MRNTNFPAASVVVLRLKPVTGLLMSTDTATIGAAGRILHRALNRARAARAPGPCAPPTPMTAHIASAKEMTCRNRPVFINKPLFRAVPDGTVARRARLDDKNPMNGRPAGR